MPRLSTAAAATPLMDDVEFLAELEQQDYVSAPPLDAARYRDAFDALEAGLPVTSNVQPVEVQHHEREPIRDEQVPLRAPDVPLADPPVPAGPTLSFAAAAFVILLCLGAGAATATLVFHDSVSRISALVTASR